MLDRDAAMRIDQRVIDATTMRAEGFSLKAVARSLGITSPRQLVSTLRSSYEEELGVNNSVAAAHQLDQLGFLDLTAIGLKHTPPLSRFGRADRVLVANFIVEPPAYLQGDSLTLAEKDYKTMGPDSLITRLGASNMTHLLAIGRGLDSTGRLALTDTFTDVSPDEIAAALKTPEKPQLQPLTPRWLYPDHPESQPKLIDIALTGRQGEIFKLAAEGLTGQEARRVLKIAFSTYQLDLAAAAEAVGLDRPSGAGSKEVSDAHRIIIVNALMASREIDPVKIASNSFKQLEALKEAFENFNPDTLRLINQVCLGKTISSIVQEISTATNRYGKPITREAVEIRIRKAREQVRAKTRTHLAVLNEANKRLNHN